MSLAEMSQPSAQHITLRASSILHRTVSQHWDTQCCVPSLLSLGYRPARTLLARLWGRLLHKGKCSAEHLPSSDATPCRCCLRVFRSFLLLPYCPTLSRVGTGGSHPPLFPSVGFASLPGSSMERHIPQDTSLGAGCRQGHGSDGFCQPLFIPPKGCSVPSQMQGGVSAWHLGTGPRLPPAPHPLLTPESWAGNTSSPQHCPRRGVCAQTPTLAPAGLSLLHPLRTTASKEPAGTKSFLRPLFCQEPGADLLSVRLWKAEG